MGIASLLLLAGCVQRERVDWLEPREPFTVESVAASVEAGVSEQSLADGLRRHGIVRPAHVDDVVLLKRAGASDGFVICVLNTPVTMPQAGRFVVRRWMEVDWETVERVLSAAAWLLLETLRGVIVWFGRR